MAIPFALATTHLVVAVRRTSKQENVAAKVGIVVQSRGAKSRTLCLNTADLDAIWGHWMMAKGFTLDVGMGYT